MVRIEIVKPPTEPRQRPKDLQDVHAPSSPLHTVGWKKSQSHHATEGGYEGEHHHHDFDLLAAILGRELERLTSEVGLLQRDVSDDQEPADADTIVWSGSL